jgi:hypothetical protein
MLLSRSPLSDEQVGHVREFCEKRQFDMCYLPGLSADEVNRYTVLDRPAYYEAARELMSNERSRFYGEYLFHVRPATDDCPYFFRFFKWSSLPRLVKGMGVEWVPFVEWGYLALVATVAQAIVVSLVFIALPLLISERRTAAVGRKRWVVAYFASLGFGYMFLEIAFMQKLMLFLAYPIYAVAVVLSGFLVFSGAGSYVADRFPGRKTVLVRRGVLVLLVLAATYLAVLPGVFTLGAGWGDGVKVLVSFLVLAPLAFCMGMPFPSGLQVVSDRYRELVPWAWGVNGLTSVVGAGLAVWLAIHGGFRMLVVVACIIYAAALLSLRVLEGQDRPGA